MAETLGFDIGGTNLRAIRLAADGIVQDRRAERIPRDPEAVLARIIAIARDMAGPETTALGIGVPGRVDFPAAEMLSGGYIDFTGHRLAARVTEATGLPVTLDNDANMALAGEAGAGAAQGLSEAVLLTIGTGIGGAVLSRGTILRGARTAGQLGHLTTDLHGPPCLCGRRGCIETLSSGTALGRLLEEGGWPPGTGIETILSAAEAGEERALRLTRAWAGPLRAATATLAAAFDPEAILLGGGLGHAALRALALVPEDAGWFRPRLLPAALGDDAGVIGAALSARR